MNWLITAVAAVSVLTATATAAHAASSSSDLQSVSTGTCVVVPGGTTDINTNLQVSACDGSATQRFTFTAVPGDANIYALINAANGMCVQVYRFNFRQNTCAQPISDNPAPALFQLQPAGSNRGDFQLIPASQLSSTMPRCMTAIAPSTGSSRGSLTDEFCDSTAGHTFHIAALP